MYNRRRKGMQEKESKTVVRCELKIPSFGITFRHYAASLVVPNSYPRDEIFNPHLTTIKDSYFLVRLMNQRIQNQIQIARRHYNSKTDFPEIMLTTTTHLDIII